MFSKLIHVVPYCTRFFLFNVSVIFYSLSVPASSGKSRETEETTLPQCHLCVAGEGYVDRHQVNI